MRAKDLTQQLLTFSKGGKHVKSVVHLPDLVRDDEKLIRDIVVQFLTVIGFEAAKAEDGREAMDRYRKAKESGHVFDVVIMDIRIPDGYEF